MPLRERAAGPGLEVPLETNGLLFRREFDRHDEGPRPMTSRMTRRAVVMPVESTPNVIRDSDVMSRCVSVASDDVDDPFPDSVHVPTRQCITRTSLKYCEIRLGCLGNASMYAVSSEPHVPRAAEVETRSEWGLRLEVRLRDAFGTDDSSRVAPARQPSPCRMGLVVARQAQPA
jgi:hypothetical protein